ncbi:ArsR family transcriptional regulator [Nocardia sp. 2]|uniref:ArsR family transcriptional regulator n=1 Tax=Nocardia acididurans TaxID=2802282 RepID=A0ABS1MDY4_9NOCA|nr:helix-turn-helix domain-containing protein [Nocardia acididurans]MBL1078772.1 ArsR family transcriptional regulator [Nocardia acididurans]
MPDTEAAPVLPAIGPPPALPAVLGALQDPVRLEMIRRLANAGTALRCAALYDGVSKSTAAHHFKILREAGLTERLTVEGHIYQRLRTDDVNEALPGLLPAILTAANRADE